MIHVRVCRIWDSINTKNNGELISLDMVLIDEKKDLMHAVIKKGQVKRYRHMLTEGSVFAIKNFKVSENAGTYRPINSNFKITFYVTTSLKKIDEDTIRIPINGFQFIKPEMLDERVNNNTILSDVIGCLCGIGDMESVGSKWKKRDIEVITNYSVKAKITLWESFGEKFEPYLYKGDGGPYIVIVTSVTVKQFRGEIGFSTTSASKIYVNLETDYVTSLVDEFAASCNEIHTIQNSNGGNIPLEEEMFLNRMSIKELLDCNWSDELQEYFVTVKAKITGIVQRFGWYYVSCNLCSTKLIPENSVYRCPSCDRECKLPLVRFKVHVTVDDGVEKTTVVLFNAVAEKLLDTSAHKLFNRLDSGSTNVPEQLKNLCGKYFIFKLKLNSYNFKQGDENFTVSKLFIPNDDLESKYYNQKIEKGKIVMDDASEPKKKVANRICKHKGKIVIDDASEPKKKVANRICKHKEAAYNSLDKLVDSWSEPPIDNTVKIRKRRTIVIDDDETPLSLFVQRKIVKNDGSEPNKEEPVDNSLDKLEDSDCEQHVGGAAKSRSRRNIVIDDEVSDEDSTK